MSIKTLSVLLIITSAVCVISLIYMYFAGANPNSVAIVIASVAYVVILLLVFYFDLHLIWVGVGFLAVVYGGYLISGSLTSKELMVSNPAMNAERGHAIVDCVSQGQANCAEIAN